jgi:hypothetical protein
MIREDAQRTLQVGARHIGGDLDVKMIPYDCPGGFAVISPVPDQPDLWYILTGYHVNIFEDLEAAFSAPPVVRLPRDAVVASG